MARTHSEFASSQQEHKAKGKTIAWEYLQDDRLRVFLSKWMLSRALEALRTSSEISSASYRHPYSSLRYPEREDPIRRSERKRKKKKKLLQREREREQSTGERCSRAWVTVYLKTEKGRACHIKEKKKAVIWDERNRNCSRRGPMKTSHSDQWDLTLPTEASPLPPKMKPCGCSLVRLMAENRAQRGLLSFPPFSLATGSIKVMQKWTYKNKNWAINVGERWIQILFKKHTQNK